jgi:hypothetical protein
MFLGALNVLLVCESDWSEYGVSNIVGDHVVFCILQSCRKHYIDVHIGSSLYGFLSFGMGCRVGFYAAACVWLNFGKYALKNSDRTPQIFSFTIKSKLALGCTHHPTQWLLEALSQ